jgi:hypothetical protein
MTLKHVLIGAIALVAVCQIVVLLIAYMLFWPVKTLVITGSDADNPVSVITKTVARGQYLSYELSYCKYTDLPSTVSRILVDGQKITLVETAGVLPKGCFNTTINTAKIPDTINPGRYALDVTVYYRINDFRTEQINYSTEYFNVI